MAAFIDFSVYKDTIMASIISKVKECMVNIVIKYYGSFIAILS